MGSSRDRQSRLLRKSATVGSHSACCPTGDAPLSSDEGDNEGSLGGHEDNPGGSPTGTQGKCAASSKGVANITFRDGETVDDFSLRISGMANNLRLLDDEISDDEVVKELLQVVPDRFMQVAISIEMLLDISKLSIEEVIDRLRTMEQRYVEREKGYDSRLLFSTREEELIRWLDLQTS